LWIDIAHTSGLVFNCTCAFVGRSHRASRRCHTRTLGVHSCLGIIERRCVQRVDVLAHCRQKRIRKAVHGSRRQAVLVLLRWLIPGLCNLAGKHFDPAAGCALGQLILGSAGFRERFPHNHGERERLVMHDKVARAWKSGCLVEDRIMLHQLSGMFRADGRTQVIFDFVWRLGDEAIQRFLQLGHPMAWGFGSSKS